MYMFLFAMLAECVLIALRTPKYVYDSIETVTKYKCNICIVCIS